jgi:hypothetical protein
MHFAGVEKSAGNLLMLRRSQQVAQVLRFAQEDKPFLAADG